MMATLESDPIDIMLGADGDLALDDAGVQVLLSSGLPAVAQGIRVRLLTFRGEWFADLGFGVPWYQDVLGRKFDRRRCLEAVRPSVASAPNVVEVAALTADFDGVSRALTVAFRARTAFGDTAESVLVKVG